ncbi:unnamed protein product [Sphagnum jensenii]|uniref:NAD-dependent epimerase/dehydratase domain-containing protein n=1 Tax=Sphagnum jensenii TaxID=128206 RepID=A0ABP0WSU8_9BRYO
MANFATLGFEFRLPFSAPPKEASSFLSSSSTTIAPPPPRQQWCPGGGGGGRRRRSECRLWQCLERSLQSYKKVGYQEGLRAAQAKNSNAGAREEEEEAGEEESGEKECEKRVFMFGMGYTCIALANTLQKQNWIVSGTCRSDEKVAGLQSRGFQAFHFNPDNDGENLKSLYAATHVLSSIPPVGDFNEDPVLQIHKQELVQAAAQGKLRWIGYLSSTGVYGDWSGNWVDEDSVPQPTENRAIARLKAENAWLQVAQLTGVAVHIFRLGGIYGPGRSALDTVLRQQHPRSGQQKLRDAHRFTSRVHVADICQVLTKAMEHHCISVFRRIFNVVDDDPMPRSTVMAFARTLLHKTGIKEASLESSAEVGASDGLKSKEDSGREVPEKRVSNKRIKEELQVELLYPSFTSGLQAIFEGVHNPFD